MMFNRRKRQQQLGTTGSGRDLAAEAKRLGQIAFDLWEDYGDNEGAIAASEQQAVLLRAIGDRSGEAAVLGFISDLYNGIGNVEQALSYNQRAHALWQAFGTLDEQAGSEVCLASDAGRMGMTRDANRHLEQALKIAGRIESPEERAGVYSAVSDVYHRMGEPQKALKFLKMALDAHYYSGTEHRLGEMYREQGALRQALSHFIGAWDNERDTDDQFRAEIFGDIWTTCAKLGEWTRPMELLEWELDLSREDGAKRDRGIPLRELGLNHWITLETKEAIAHFERNLDLRRSLGDRGGEAKALNRLALIHLVTEQTGKAIERMEQALLVDRSARNQLGQARMLHNLGVAYREIDQRDAAANAFAASKTLYEALGRQEDAEIEEWFLRAVVPNRPSGPKILVQRRPRPE